MSEFETWPVNVADDLRILRQAGDEGEDYRMVYSFGLDALTPVSLDEVERLRQRGVQEITELPE